MAEPPGHPSVWKAGVLVGVCLIVIGLSAGYIDVATHVRFSFLSANFGIFLVALFAGLLLSFIATIGWARRFTRSGRLRAAGLVFVLPWLGMLLANQIEHFNVHGPSVFLYSCPTRRAAPSYRSPFHSRGAGSAQRP